MRGRGGGGGRGPKVKGAVGRGKNRGGSKDQRICQGGPKIGRESERVLGRAGRGFNS